MEAEVSAVRAAHRLDEVALQEYLVMQGLQGALRVEQFTNGQSNPTYLLHVGSDQHLVLRKKPPGQLLPRAHAVDREFRIISSLHAAGWSRKGVWEHQSENE